MEIATKVDAVLQFRNAEIKSEGSRVDIRTNDAEEQAENDHGKGFQNGAVSQNYGAYKT